MMRALEYEHEFLTEVEKSASRSFNIPTDGFVVCVKNRLAMGQELYGDAFMQMDDNTRARNLAEEGWDGGAYSVMDAQARILKRTDSDSALWHTFEAAKHAAAIHYHSRCLMRGDDE